MKVLLTSCGLETDNIRNKFIDMLNMNPSEVRAMFIPTAAVDADAICVLPKCMNDLLKCGIKKESITVYDLHKPMTAEETKRYDIIYICGGNTEYLLERINESDFGTCIKAFINDNRSVVGVSAGSIIFADNLKNSLGLLNRRLDVHCDDDQCEPAGSINMTGSSPIRLGNHQGLVFESESSVYII
ncbi:MAG: Type 1 glutamine amidotransferase-like domain-containing protein [Oscillospiraceae bacterium]|nr:Type 1 glutamine amidotransferase-like domain-containing protein [Oscillospiraceae bacterium]